MAQYNFNEKRINSVFTGYDYREKQLLTGLKAAFSKAESVDIIVSFIMESGVYEIIEDLKSLSGKNVKIRILTSDYLSITDPSALYLLKAELGENLDLRLYKESSRRSFHAKSYIIRNKNSSKIFIGSSNISRSALKQGIEWNYCIDSKLDPQSFREYSDTFNELFNFHSIKADDETLKRYALKRRKPKFSSGITYYDTKGEASAVSDSVAPITNVVDMIRPRGAQIEALYYIEKIRDEGAKKALAQCPCGFGKTYLSAFDVKNFGTKRLLFIAHREEILRQAEATYRRVFGDIDTGFFAASNKDCDSRFIFASVSTLGKDDYLNAKYFKRDDFDYIVIDEFHHAVNKNYKNILSYFKPKFMLGLTATPDRMDGRDIYRICDYNVAYEMNLHDAINTDMLLPFHYYGIYDETDYSDVKISAGRYKDSDLDKIYIGNLKRLRLITSNYLKYRRKRALAFCTSRAHAFFMASEFIKAGIKAAAVYSSPINGDDNIRMDRSDAITALQKRDIEIIFSVDIFNEGVDIPSIDTVLFLRPTESPVVFIQQLGRGLRKYHGKKYLTVLDFIGNYMRADSVKYLLTGERYKSGDSEREVNEENFYPDNCIVDFDLRLIDLFKKMRECKFTKKEIIKNEFMRVKDILGDVPRRLDLFMKSDDAIYDLMMKNSKINPFRNYLLFLNENECISDEELSLYRSIAGEFLNVLECTSMSRVYKMPVLMAFYNNGDIKRHLSSDDLLKYWKEFFFTGLNWKDLLTKNIDTKEKIFNLSDTSHLKKIKSMPVKYLLKSGDGFFRSDMGYIISLDERLYKYLDNEAFKKHFKDIIKYRTLSYYKSRYENM